MALSLPCQAWVPYSPSQVSLLKSSQTIHATPKRSAFVPCFSHCLLTHNLLPNSMSSFPTTNDPTQMLACLGALSNSPDRVSPTFLPIQGTEYAKTDFQLSIMLEYTILYLHVCLSRKTGLCSSMAGAFCYLLCSVCST